MYFLLSNEYIYFVLFHHIF